MYKRLHLIFFLLIILVTVYLFFPSFEYNKLPGYSDLYLYSNWRINIHNSFRQGEFPLWFPQHMGGIPFTVTYNPSLYYPLTFLLKYLDNNTYTNFLYISHFIMIPMFMYFLLMYLKLEKFAAAIGSMIWAWSGYIIMRYWCGHSCFIIAFTYTPLIIMYFLKTLNTGKYIYVWLTAFFMGLQFFAGRPELVIYTQLIMIIYLVLEIYKKKKIVYHLKRYVILYVLFFLLVLIQLMPLLIFSQYSIRGKSYIYSVLSSFPWQNFITYLLPYFFGVHKYSKFWGTSNFYELYSYCGILPLFILILVLFNRKNKNLKLFLFFIVLGWILALGKYNPLYRYISIIIYPLSMLRAPSRAMFISLFGFTMLTAYGLDYYLKNKILINKKINFLFIICSISGFILLIISFIPQEITVNYLNSFLNINKLSLKYSTVYWKLRHTAVLLLLYPILFLFIKNKKILIGLLFFICFYETIIFNRQYFDYTGTKLDYSDDKVVTTVANDKSYFRLLSNEHILDTSKYNIYNISTTRAFTPTYIKDVCDYLKIGVDSEYNYLKKSEFDWYGIKYINNYNSKFLDLFNVKYFYKYNIDTQKNKNFKKILGKLYYKKDIIPRFKFYYDYMLASDFNKTLNLIKQDDFDYKNKIIVNSDKFNKDLSSELMADDKNIIKSVDYGYNHILLNVDCKYNSILFTSEVYYPGWKVEIDGKRRKLLKLDGIFRGVYCKPGIKKIKFYFYPDYLNLSLISIVIFFVVGILLFMYNFLTFHEKE